MGIDKKTTDIYLASMRLKETGSDRILGYYKQDDDMKKIYGDSPEEFVLNLRNKIGMDVKLHNKDIPYFKKLIPIPKRIDDHTYEEIAKLNKKNAHIPQTESS